MAMATETATLVNETEIEVNDQIELDRRLKKSLEQFERGETMSIEEAEKIMKERFASGYYDKK
ncbi:MAG: hypothetical protein LBC87_03185 [Fibromonadaceae bacterium]|jgi:hypothetical protein|nr:hypothetical protein [Fibromonadaceae bacterium]